MQSDYKPNSIDLISGVGQLRQVAYRMNIMKPYKIVHSPKVDLRKGAVVASIGAGFVVGSEVLETLVPVQGNLLGVVVAVVILLLLRPVKLLALHLAGETDESPAYPESRKLEVYRAAYRGALEDGVVTEREKSILGYLRDNLDLSDAEVASVEQEFKSGIP